MGPLEGLSAVTRRAEPGRRVVLLVVPPFAAAVAASAAFSGCRRVVGEAVGPRRLRVAPYVLLVTLGAALGPQ